TIGQPEVNSPLKAVPSSTIVVGSTRDDTWVESAIKTSWCGIIGNRTRVLLGNNRDHEPRRGDRGGKLPTSEGVGASPPREWVSLACHRSRSSRSLSSGAGRASRASSLLRSSAHTPCGACRRTHRRPSWRRALVQGRAQGRRVPTPPAGRRRPR